MYLKPEEALLGISGAGNGDVNHRARALEVG